MQKFPSTWKWCWYGIVMIVGVMVVTVDAEERMRTKLQSRNHIAVDMPAPKGTPIHVVKDGIVSLAKWVTGYGNVVYVEHENHVQTRYAHMSKILTTVGQNVTMHEIIGLVGSTGRSTGPHVHYEVRVKNKRMWPSRFGWPLPILGVLSDEEPIEE